MRLPPGPSPRMTPPFTALRVRKELQRREVGRNPMVYIVLISIIVAIIIIGVLAVWLRSLRARHPNPKLLPTSYLKNKWINWRVPTYSSRGSYRTTNSNDSVSGGYDPGLVIQIEHSDGAIPTTEPTRPRDGTRRVRAGTTTRNGGTASNSGNNGSGGGTNGTVDRNTSIRSVITLPAYKAEATENEQVLGREGERDGIDVVLEMRTAEEAEDLRDAEMEQLFQIRQHRRARNQEREARRERRRRARQNGDIVELELLREEARRARDDAELDELRRELEDIKSERDRHASVVSYASVGVARHDGTRIRAESVGEGGDAGSERVGLLSDAESMAQASPGLGGDSRRRSSLLAWPHGRGRSSGSIDTAGDFPSPGIVHTRSRAGSRGTMESRASTTRDLSPGLTTPTAGFDSRRTSSVTLSAQSTAVYEVDLGDERMPPPGYEDVELEDERRRSASVSRGPTPTPDDPPPGYVSRGNSLRDSTVGDEGLGIRYDANRGGEEGDERRSGRDVGGIPHLPSLRLATLPQIVVEQTSRPGSSRGGTS